MRVDQVWSLARYRATRDEERRRRWLEKLMVYWRVWKCIGKVVRDNALRVSPTRLPDKDFRNLYRVSKNTARQLVQLLGLQNDPRGHPLHPMQALCLCLAHLGGNQMLKYTGRVNLGPPVTKTVAHRIICEVRDKILQLKSQYIKMPSLERMEETSWWGENKFHLKGFAYGVDGMLTKFKDQPKNIPIGDGYPVANDFFTRKGWYGINVLVLGDEQHRILALDADWHGSAHDSVIWEGSSMEKEVEKWPFLVAGDSGFTPTTKMVALQIQCK